MISEINVDGLNISVEWTTDSDSSIIVEGINIPGGQISSECLTEQFLGYIEEEIIKEHCPERAEVKKLERRIDGAVKRINEMLKICEYEYDEPLERLRKTLEGEE